MEYLKDLGGIQQLMKLVAVDSVKRGLEQEDEEMADQYKRMTGMLYDEQSSKPLDSPQGGSGKGGSMLVAGGIHIDLSPQEMPPLSKQAQQATREQQQVQQPSSGSSGSNGLRNTLLALLTGAGLAGGGVGLGTMLDQDEEPSPAPQQEQATVEDTDTIGILEPDK